MTGEGVPVPSGEGSFPVSPSARGGRPLESGTPHGARPVGGADPQPCSPLSHGLPPRASGVTFGHGRHRTGRNPLTPRPAPLPRRFPAAAVRHGRRAAAGHRDPHRLRAARHAAAGDGRGPSVRRPRQAARPCDRPGPAHRLPSAAHPGARGLSAPGEGAVLPR
ncbi:hypothetical protein SGPA1_50214 [Streptomyces misionensis JCM 4497]